MKAVPTTRPVEVLAEDLYRGVASVVRVNLGELPRLRDLVHAREPALLGKAEVVIVGSSAFVWLPARPSTVMQIVAERRLVESDLDALPAPAAITSGGPSAREFWHDELIDVRNLAAWSFVGVGLVIAAWLGGDSVAPRLAGPLAVFFGVWLPVLPLFFGPDPERSAAWFASGRLARWQMADRQMFGAACVGFILALLIQALASTGSPPAAAMAQFLALLAASWVATWLLATVLGYALPVLHAAQLARAAEQWRRDHAPRA